MFVERGYYATRVADIVEAAGVSHGVFYRYFDNKGALFRILAQRASEQVSEAFDGLPDLTGGSSTNRQAELRAWLRLYANSYAEEAAIFAMWSEAMTRGDELGDVSAAVLDRSRARLARHLEPRGWGDADADAMVMLTYLEAMTSRRLTTANIENIASTIERSLLTAPRATRRRPAKPATAK